VSRHCIVDESIEVTVVALSILGSGLGEFLFCSALPMELAAHQKHTSYSRHLRPAGALTREHIMVSRANSRCAMSRLVSAEHHSEFKIGMQMPRLRMSTMFANSSPAGTMQPSVVDSVPRDISFTPSASDKDEFTAIAEVFGHRGQDWISTKADQVEGREKTCHFDGAAHLSSAV